MNRGAAARLRFDQQIATDEFEPLLHAHEAKAAAPLRFLNVKAYSAIADHEVDPAIRRPESYRALPGRAMFRRIVESFLENTC